MARRRCATNGGVTAFRLQARRTASYSKPNLVLVDSGDYSVQVTNVAGAVTSQVAVLTVPMAASWGQLVSSTNPSLPGQSISFTLTLSAVAPGSGTPTGLAQFKIDGTNVGSPVVVSSGVATILTSTLSHGSHTIVAEYAGDANFGGTTNQLTPQLINTPPVAGIDSTERDPTNQVKVSIGALLSNDTDADDDQINFLAAAVSSANGGTIVSNGGWITYTPTPGFANADTFTYTINDGWGASVVGLVNINVRHDHGPSPNLTITLLSNGGL